MPYFDPAAMGFVLEEVMERTEALLLGRRSQGMAAAWPGRAERVVLGGGKRSFPDDARSRSLELVSTSTSGTGVHVCTYRPTGGS